MILFSIMFLDPTRTTTDPKNLNTGKMGPHCLKILGPPLSAAPSVSFGLVVLSHLLIQVMGSVLSLSHQGSDLNS
ncbi:hypothetical protein HanRHA438_Chr10g0459031 [Helianthus annuus]|nr:hypothetical protein HanRHA438_Chr10g0459031 [Helianthus annuus]